MKRMKNLLAIILVLAIVIGTIVLTDLNRLAVWSAPKKLAATARSEAAQKADELFWQTFHQCRVERLLLAEVERLRNELLQIRLVGCV